MRRIVKTFGQLNWGRAFAGLALCGATAMALPAQSFPTLHAFCPSGTVNCPDGSKPIGALVQGSDGNLYGTTYGGGANGATAGGGANGWGTVFKITPSGTLTTLYSFCAPNIQDNCPDGAIPNGLVQGADRNLYGTTPYGGTGNGYGTVFKLSAASYLMSGQVSLSLPNEFLAGATVTLSGTESVSVTTDDSGNYSFLAGGRQLHSHTVACWLHFQPAQPDLQ